MTVQNGFISGRTQKCSATRRNSRGDQLSREILFFSSSVALRRKGRCGMCIISWKLMLALRYLNEYIVVCGFSSMRTHTHTHTHTHTRLLCQSIFINSFHEMMQKWLMTVIGIHGYTEEYLGQPRNFYF